MLWGAVIPTLRVSNWGREAWFDSGLDAGVPAQGIVQACATSLAAAELLEEKRRARRMVADGGAHCLELPPGDLAAASVNRYLEAKSRGLL